MQGRGDLGSGFVKSGATIREHTPGAKARYVARPQRPKVKALGYLEAQHVSSAAFCGVGVDSRHEDSCWFLVGGGVGVGVFGGLGAGCCCLWGEAADDV